MGGRRCADPVAPCNTGGRRLMTLMTLIRQSRTSSMVTCGRPPTPISRMLPACTGNGRRQCCGINPSEQPSLGASSQPRLRKAIVERDCARLNNAYGGASWWLPLLRLRQRRRPQPRNCFGPPPPFASSMPAALATLASKSARLWFVKDVLETAWPLLLAVAENGTGLHRTARRTRPPTHRLAAAVDAADARVALPCHIALDQRPRTRGRLWNGTLMGCTRCVVGS